MSRLIRMDQTGHTTLAEWAEQDSEAFDVASRAFRAELDRGFFGILTRLDGTAEQITELPFDAPTVILRRPIAGG
jgi:hypothetical protein